MSNDQEEVMKKRHLERNAKLMQEFIAYVSSPWRIFATNFLVGVSRGLGAMIGVSLVIGILLWVASMLAKTPMVGEYAERAKHEMVEMIQKADYSDEFERMQEVLERINENLKK